MNVCMYVCVYMYMCVYIYIYILYISYKSIKQHIATEPRRAERPARPRALRHEDWPHRGRETVLLRGNHLFNTTCLTQAFFKSSE